MNYGQSLDYLKNLQRFGIKLGLDNIRTLLAALNNPHKAYPSVLVAGTNGKGSVAAILARILSLHGFRTGLYTSPHLVRVEERIRLGERLISRAGLCRRLSAIKEKIDELLVTKRLENPPTFFEVVTALALSYFEEKKADIAVLEVGMGGRFDATNAVVPVVSIITTISKDHQRYLGRTLKQIAFEKAGIIKERVPIVCGVKRGTAFQVIHKRARELNSPLIEVFGPGTGFECEAIPAGYRFRYDSGSFSYSYRPSLAGVHQGENSAVAIRAAEVLSSAWRPLGEEKIIRAVETTRWEGRLETVSRKPLIILDGAHNPEGAVSLRAYIRSAFRRPVIIVFDAMLDKDIRKMGEILFPLARKVILTKVHMPRAASPEDILGFCKAFQERMILEPDVEHALHRAVREAGSGSPIIIAGSLFLVGDVKKILGLKKRGKLKLSG